MIPGKMADERTEPNENSTEEDWPMLGSALFAPPWEPNKVGKVKDELPNVQHVEMNEGTTKLPDDKPAEDGGELMAKESEQVELDSTLPADV